MNCESVNSQVFTFLPNWSNSTKEEKGEDDLKKCSQSFRSHLWSGRVQLIAFGGRLRSLDGGPVEDPQPRLLYRILRLGCGLVTHGQVIWDNEITNLPLKKEDAKLQVGHIQNMQLIILYHFLYPQSLTSFLASSTLCIMNVFFYLCIVKCCLVSFSSMVAPLLPYFVVPVVVMNLLI